MRDGHEDSGLKLEVPGARAVVSAALEEDLGFAGDITSEACVPEDLLASGVYVAREPGVLAGLPLIELVFAALSDREPDPGAAQVEVEPVLTDGDPFVAGAVLARVRGPARRLLMGERVSLNLLQRLSGIATLTRRFVDAAGSGASILDTRKTTPLLRALEKYAVRAGGGVNHRMGLYDEAMIKDNHLAALARRAGEAPSEMDPTGAIESVRQRTPGARVTIETDTLAGLERALPARPDVVLLDNMTLDELRAAVALTAERTPPGEPRPLLEASGGVNLDTVAAIAATGVDRISVGALTHSARNLDLALDLEL